MGTKSPDAKAASMAKTIHRELTVPAETTHLCRVRQAVLDVIGHGMFTPVKCNLIALAVDEAVANIMEHAFPADRPANSNDIEVILDATPQRFEVIIRDRGATFDPRDVPDVDMHKHVKEGKKGGLGIFLIRRIMDELHYRYKHGEHNELQMIKFVDEAKEPTKNKVPPKS
jgi:anti-sigma regulatory factor (Ser/Thr protein kinase)